MLFFRHRDLDLLEETVLSIYVYIAGALIHALNHALGGDCSDFIIGGFVADSQNLLDLVLLSG